MSVSNLTPRARTSEAIQSAAGPTTFKTRTLALFAIPSFAVVILSNQSRLGGEIWQWVALGCIAYAVTISVLLAFRFTVLPASDRAPKISLTMVAFFAAGTIRGFVVWLVGNEWGLIPPDDLLFRITTGFLLVFGGLSTLSIFEASRIRQIRSLNALESEKANLDDLRLGIRERIRESQRELLAKVEEIIRPIVEQLRSDLTVAGSKSAAQNIQVAVDNLIRPMSREMGQAGSAFEQSLMQDVVAVSNLKSQRNWPKAVAIGSMMVPALTVFAVLTTAIGPLSLALGTNAAFAFVLVVASTGLVSWAWQRLFRAVNAAIWIALLVSLVPAALVPITSEFTLGLFGWSLPAAVIQQYSVLLLFTILISFALQIGRTLRAQNEEQLKGIVHELGVLNSQLRQEVWFNRKRAAAVLHGPVQAALYASAMRLKTQSISNEELTRTLQADIEKALARLDSSNSIEPFESVLEQIEDVWQGLAKVSHQSISAGTKAALDANPTAASCVLEIVREAVSNAIKHGKASEIELQVEATEQFLQVTVQNNGAPLSPDAVAGYGSQILDEVCYEWSLVTEKSLTFLRASVAI